MVYDLLIGKLNKDPKKAPTTTIALTSGALTGIIMWSIVYPIDIVKTRVQLDSFSQPKYNGMGQVVKELAAGGFSNFYRGFAPVALRAIPVNAITFAAYELCIATIRKDRHH